MRFCHMDIEWCWFEEELQVSQQHGQDPLTGPLCGHGSWDLINHGAEAWKSRIGSVLWRTECRGCITLEGTERAIWVHLVSALDFTSTLVSTHTLPSPTHLCTFVHSSCEVPFWGWEHNYNRRIATTLTKSLKRYSQTEIRDSRSTSSPTSCI